MRRARITYFGAFHHAMNRGLEGKDIFLSNKEKSFFLELLQEKSKKYRIKLLAYSVMNNHYHIVLQNSSGRLSDFMKQLNGEYGRLYRLHEGGKGYVFQGRYKSTLIQEGTYLRIVIIYVLLNSVKAGLVKDPYAYNWSSIGEYFSGCDSNIVDNEFVEEILQNREEMEKLLREWAIKDVPFKKTRFGNILGNEDFLREAIKKFDRRTKKKGTKRKREKDYIFETADEVIKKFEEMKEVKIRDIDITTLEGKRLRSELLVLLRDRAGLRYSEIITYPLFRSLKYISLGQLCKKARGRKSAEKQQDVP